MTRLLLAGTGLIGHRHLKHILEHPGIELAGIIDPVLKNRETPMTPGERFLLRRLDGLGELARHSGNPQPLG